MKTLTDITSEYNKRRDFNDNYRKYLIMVTNYGYGQG